MNKYQEALNGLRDNTCNEINNCELCSLVSFCGHFSCIKELQELVDKATPKKVIRTPYKDIYGNELLESKSHFYNGCPSCKGNVGIDAQYCRHCGQKLE